MVHTNGPLLGTNEYEKPAAPSASSPLEGSPATQRTWRPPPVAPKSTTTVTPV